MLSIRRARPSHMLLFLLLAAFPAFGATFRPSFPPPLAADESLLGSHSLWIDLDADAVPDSVAIGICGRSGEESVCRVDLSLTGGGQSSYFEVRVPEALFVGLRSADLDGDHDLDVLVTAGGFRRIAAVWLNDGAGTFVPAPVARYSGQFKGSGLFEVAGSASTGQFAIVDGRPVHCLLALDSVVPFTVQRRPKRQPASNDRARSAIGLAPFSARPPPHSPQLA